MAMMHIPEDFDPAMPIRKAMEKHGIAKMTVIRWRKRCGYAEREQRLAWTDQDIHTLRTNFNAKSFAQLSAMLGRTEAAIRTKAISIGLRKSSGTFTRDVRASFHGQHAKGVADMAAQHLRRIAPVFRCDADGAANPKGKCWRYGNTVLTEAELMARAESKGWDADAWRKIA
ncbi:MAG: hypothetical protein ACTHNA_14255 [Sphingopyxis terrae]|uniref:hypothetical protein n=1 Tax=Sphingopyxis terrae TaxID=33052 RepID=UPI003F803C3E